MLIERGLNLGQLLYLMPDDATYHEAYALRDILFSEGSGFFYFASGSTSGLPPVCPVFQCRALSTLLATSTAAAW